MEGRLGAAAALPAGFDGGAAAAGPGPSVGFARAEDTSTAGFARTGGATTAVSGEADDADAAGLAAGLLLAVRGGGLDRTAGWSWCWEDCGGGGASSTSLCRRSCSACASSCRLIWSASASLVWSSLANDATSR